MKNQFNLFKTNLLIGLLILSGCQSRNSLDDAEAAFRSFFETVEKMDYEGMRNACTPDFTVFEDGIIWTIEDWVAFLKPLEGKASIKYGFRDMKKTFDGNTVWLTYNNVADAEFGGAPVHFDWLESAVLKRQNREWKLAFLHSTTSKSLPVNMKAREAELTDDEYLAVEDIVKQLVDVLEKGMNDIELNVQFNLMSDDPDFTFSGNGYINPPKDSYYIVAKSSYDNFSDITTSYETKRITVLGKNAAVFTGQGPFSVTDLSGTKTGGQLVSTFVFARRNDKWQIIHGHTSHAWEN
jgi:ketosteroid isomerase-like protein